MGDHSRELFGGHDSFDRDGGRFGQLLVHGGPGAHAIHRDAVYGERCTTIDRGGWRLSRHGESSCSGRGCSDTLAGGRVWQRHAYGYHHSCGSGRRRLLFRLLGNGGGHDDASGIPGRAAIDAGDGLGHGSFDRIGPRANGVAEDAGTELGPLEDLAVR